MIRILLAVDSEDLRPRLKAILTEITGVETVHDVANLQYVANEVSEFKPDIVILSLLKLCQSSTRLASFLRAENPNLPIIALTGPFTVRDEISWKKGGVDRAFNINLGLELLIDYVSAFVDAETKSGQVNMKDSQSQSK